MKQKIIAANWKMNKTLPEAVQLIEQVSDYIMTKRLRFMDENVMVVLALPYVYLYEALYITRNVPHLALAAQNCYTERKGAFTGEISAEMLQSIGTEYVIIGHSERRNYFKEDDNTLLKKVDMALEYDLRPIFCVGESLDERLEDRHFHVIQNQLKNSVFHLPETDFANVVIAYEPVWAIGTGKTASPIQADRMHQFIRSEIFANYSEKTAQNTSILYGGSCNAENARELFSKNDIDGGLIGGASLNACDFQKIIESLY